MTTDMITRNPERLRRVRNLKPCHEIRTLGGWSRVVSVAPDKYNRDYVRIRLEGREVPWRKARLVPSRLAGRRPAVVCTSLTERDYELINRLMPVVVAGWKEADDLTLQREAERLDSVQGSPVVLAMRAIVETERALRAGRGAPHV